MVVGTELGAEYFFISVAIYEAKSVYSCLFENNIASLNEVKSIALLHNVIINCES